MSTFLTSQEHAATIDSLKHMHDRIVGMKREAPTVSAALEKFTSIAAPNTATVMLVGLASDSDPTNPFAVFDDDALEHIVIALETDEENWVPEESREKTRQLQILAVAEAERRPSYLERFIDEDGPTITKGPKTKGPAT